MLHGPLLKSYINKPMNMKTSSGLYVKIEELSESNNIPTYVLVPNKAHATEFIMTRKSETNVSIRVNTDMKNQNGLFGYHLYVVPESDIIYGSGNDETWAQFTLEEVDNYVRIKSAYKDAWFCHSYNVLRCRNQDTSIDFSIEFVHVPQVQKALCIIGYGFMSSLINLSNSPIMKTLKKIYPTSTIDVHILTPNVLDEFGNITFDPKQIAMDGVSVNVHIYQYDISHFMKLAHGWGLPIISDKNKVYAYRTMSMFRNMSEAIKCVLKTKSQYNTYILVRNDSFHNIDLYEKLIDQSKLYCYNGDSIDTHLMVGGNDMLQLSNIYDFYVKNKDMYRDATPEQIINHFINTKGFRTGLLGNIAPPRNYQINENKKTEIFYKTVYSKYKEFVNYERPKH